jgi:TolB protein
MSKTNRLGIRGVLAAAGLLAVSLLVLIAAANPAGAAFPGKNGKIAFMTFSPRTEDSQIHTINPDGSEQSKLGSGYSPSWSADGQMVVFERYSDGSEDSFNQDIYVMDSDGSDVRRITTSRAYDHSPSFSPDGQTIVFVRESRRSGADLFTIKLDGTGLMRLTETEGVFEESPVFSPDGTKIAFSRLGYTGQEISVMNSDGTEQKNLTNTRRIEEFAPDWSPDGSRIAFTSQRFSRLGGGEEPEEDRRISVMNSDGTSKKDLTEGDAIDVLPAFSPNGKRIAFSRITFSGTQGESADIFVMRADGSVARRLTDTRAFEFGPDWQPLPEQAATEQ